VLYEAEPNDTPAEANAFAGEGLLMGTLTGRDQDGFRWRVSDQDTRRRWTLELSGVPGRMTAVDVYRLTFGVNGVEVTDAEKLFTLTTQTGERPAVAQDLLFEPGEYLLGVAHSGAGPGFRPPGAELGLGEALSEVGEEQQGEATAPVPGGYRLRVREGARLSVADRPARAGSPEAAEPLRLDRLAAAYHPEPVAWYGIELPEERGTERWDLLGQVPVGADARAVLRDGAGEELTGTVADELGKLRLPDLGLAPGDYLFEVAAGSGEQLRAVGLLAAGQRIEGGEAEPNDSWALANRIELTPTPTTGRMGRNGESDGSSRGPYRGSSGESGG
jgi:hypothetical protein